MRNKYIFFLLLTTSMVSVPVLAQEKVVSETPLKSAIDADNKSTFTRPGAHLIPGTKANPLASPDSVPGDDMGKVLLQPYTEMTGHFDHTMPDNASYSKTLIDLLEYRFDGANSDVHWDLEHWQGGDYSRWKIKTEGKKSIHNSHYEADIQLLKSRLTHPYTEFQYGLRLQTQGGNGSHIARPQAVVGFQALMPYNYELGTALYVDAHGNISASLEAEKDLLITQKLILQPRLEADAALQQVERFGVGRGLNTMSFGLRLRYEIRREFAPYIGITYDKAFGRTASFVRQNGGDPSQWRFVAGVRMWF